MAIERSYHSGKPAISHPKGEIVPATRLASGWIVFESEGEPGVDPMEEVAKDRARRLDHLGEWE